jgi:hypothetical protein
MSFAIHLDAKASLLVFVIVILGFCRNTVNKTPPRDKIRQDSLPEKILIINSFDAASMKARKNKQELFNQLADSLKQILYQKITPPFKAGLEIHPGLLKDSANFDSTVRNLMNAKASTIAIVIRKLDVAFENTDVETTGNNKEGKSTEVSYDICADITYAIYNSAEEHSLLPINICQPYTKRPSFSGLITFGPDVVGKRKDAFKIITKNADKFLSSVSLSAFWEKYKQETRK